MSSPEEWAQQLKRWGQKNRLVTERVAINGALTMRLRVAMRTPIRTGRASGSWNLSVDEPNTKTKPETFFNPDNAPWEGEVNVQGYRLGKLLIITNRVPYINRLNAGSSRQAPAGFIEAAVQETQATMPKIVGEVRVSTR